MPVRFSRLAIGALAVLGVLSVGAGSAFAQAADMTSANRSLTTGTNFSVKAVTPLAATERALTASIVTTAPKVNFQAQQNAGSGDNGIGFGALAMLTRTSFRSEVDDFFDVDNRTGYGFGLWVGGNRNGRVGFTGEFIYLVRGDDEFRTKALQIPAVFHINLGSRSRNGVGGYLVVGPSFTINLSQEADGIDISDDFNGADIGIIGGAGIEFLRIGIEGRGNWGLRSIDNGGEFGEIKTFTFELLGKFAFN